jgi:hypothetical protein
MGLHAVQFGNNWMTKIRGLPSPIWQSEEFFEFNYFQIGQHVVLLLVNYIMRIKPKTIQLIQKLSN